MKTARAGAQSTIPLPAPFDAVKATDAMRRPTRLRLTLLAVLPFSSVLLGITGLFVFPLLAGMFLASAFQAARPFWENPRDEVIRARIVQGLLYAFIPGLLLVGSATALGSELKVGRFPIEAFLLVGIYIASAAGSGLASYYIVQKRGSDLERKVSDFLRWPLIVSAVWATFCQLLDVFITIDFVDFFQLMFLGFWGCILVLFALAVPAVRRTFKPSASALARTTTAMTGGNGPTNPTPSFVPFGSNGR